MVKRQQGLALRHVQVLFGVGTTGDMSDRQLLERLWSCSEDSAEPAFGALVERHGPMVLRACRSILRDEQAVEDAFQATFLVLVRRGRSLWVRNSLGPWLYQVAARVSRSARSAENRRRRHEREKAERTDVSVFDRTSDDIGTVIHEELARLPERLRAAVILCCVEGLSQQQAAGKLGWPLGTLQSRLARGRDRLRGRLSRRGLAPSAGLVAAVLSAHRAEAAIPVALANSTVRAAMQLLAGNTTAAGVATASAGLLARGVLKTMFLHKVVVVICAALALAVTGAGALVLAEQALRADAPAPLENPVTAIEGSTLPSSLEVDPKLFVESQADDEFDPDQQSEVGESGNATNEVRGDGKPDGKKSIGGSGEMIELTLPGKRSKVTGVKIHGSRYGRAQPPKESFLIYFLSEDRERILHTEMAPYSLFKRGAESWVEVKFENPVVGLPHTFWLALDFRAAQTKGVYVSFDTSTSGKSSRVGLPGMASSEVDFGGDWMIEGIFVE
jgi:RNA polymerase sigma factor (sigma-70 family)